MRGMCALLAMGLLLLAPRAHSLESRTHAFGNELRRRIQDPERLAPFGLLLDANLPEKLGWSAVFWPSRYMRLQLGGAHNGLRLGGRLAVTLLPLRTRHSPSLTFEAGHAFSGNAHALTRRLSDSSQIPGPTMDRVGYSYASAHLGFELGAPGRYTFFVRGGMSWVQLDVPNLESLGEPFLAKLSTLEAQGGRFLYARPSAKLGLIVYFG
ncbi:hypothetical protein POL68_16745 [Stigmatella sp. ncwal1]|uniref:Outer membrane protein beta-barrel domain-containing protein n=1 Tax=Stigmatella ashevillensis TaxID=2995309 RepID=A0ABT5D8X4_9BACT|nr:hypothetical protein [Stigmatella ashevillena]MDC0710127.1 hypothetical protein [Stigmatella ashevillena]